MPESEPKPKLIEQVAPGAGQGWKAVLRSGKAVVVHEIPVPQAEAIAAAPRLQRLFEHRHPALSAVLAWGTDPNGVWVAVEPNEGTPLGSILTRGPLTPFAAAALGGAVLSGVAALHEAGIAMGGFGATAIRVNSNGEVRIAGHPAAAVRGAPSQSDLRADVRSCGMAVCAAFGVDPAGAPAPANIPPGLVVTMRSMASGAMGPSADRAQGALREMAAALLAPDRQMAAQAELATRAGGRDVPAITPFLPEGTVPPPPRTTPSSVTVPAIAPAPSAPAPPAPYLSPARRDETPVRIPVSYDAPDRPLQTYPAMPAMTFPPAAAAPPEAPAPVAPVTPAAPAPAVPTWSDAAPVPPVAPAYEEPAVRTTNPPAPAPLETSEPAVESPAPAWQPSTPPAIPAAAAAPAWQTAPPAPAEPAYATNPPAFATNPPAPAAPVEPKPPASAAPAEQTWTPMEQPVWKPGGAVPSEPLGFGMPVAEVRTPTPAPAPRAAAPPPSRKLTVARPRLPSLPSVLSERPSWLVPAAAAVVIVLLLGIVGGILFANRGSKPAASVQTPSTHPTSSPKVTPSTQPTGGPLAVPVFAPASAGAVSKVQICTQTSPCKIPGAANENATSCDLGARCQVEVAVYFSTTQKSVAVAYTLKFFDRCTGQTTDLPGTRTTTPATGWIVAIPTDHLSVALPAGVKSGALVAVTQQPGAAASAPLLLGGSSC